MTSTKKKILAVVLGVVILALGVGIGAVAASAYGTESDPLVAKSYLDNTLTPKLQQQFQSTLDSKIGALEEKITSGSGSFAVKNLSAGQSLSCSAGCQLILLSGSAGSLTNGLTDVTDGSAVSGGSSIAANHLLVAYADGNGITAKDACTVLVRGSCSVG